MFLRNLNLVFQLFGKGGNAGYVQIADNPGRNEPGTGEISYPFLFDLLATLGYQGWVGCEYRPLMTTEEGLGWASSYLK